MQELNAQDPRINWEAWGEWEEWRRTEKRKKITPRAAQLQQKLLAKYDHETQRAMIEQSIQNDWQGLFALKGQPVGKGMLPKGSTRSRSLADDLNDRSWAE